MYQISSTADIASFDLYDTIIMRQSLTTAALYKSVWEVLKDAGHSLPDCATFVGARSQADKASKHIDAPSLKQILEYLGNDLLGLAEEIESVEIALELDQLRKVPGSARKIEQARHAGCRIAFISDMHIGAMHLGRKLREMDLLLDGDLLFVSSDHAVSKSRRGRLFRHFLKVNKIPAGTVTHYGNNEWSDIKMAANHGISAYLCPTANLNRFESLLVNESVTCSTLENIASISRDVRLQCGTGGGFVDTEISKEEEALCHVSSSVVSPVLVAFVLWTIKRCREAEISTIRFLTRDGELPYLIAKALPDEITEGLDLGMLEVSRKSLFLPAASVVSLEKWLKFGLESGSYLVQHFERLPARQLIARVGMSFDSHADLLSPYGIVDPEKPLGDAGLCSWKRALQSDSIRQAIEQESRKRLTNTNTYLWQNLPSMSEKRSALVDIGWTGQQAAMLSALIRQQGGLDPLHLHVGRLRDRPLIAPADIEAWLFDERVKSSPVENPVALFESFCVTLSGGVERYEIDSAGVAKSIRLTQAHQSDILFWGQPLLRRCVLQFAEQAGGLMSDIDSELLRSTCEKLLRQFWENPKRHEAIKWGAFPYEQDQTGQTIRQLANPYNLAQLRSRMVSTYSGIDWKAGSVELSPSPLRQMLKLREMYRKR